MRQREMLDAFERAVLLLPVEGAIDPSSKGVWVKAGADTQRTFRIMRGPRQEALLIAFTDTTSLKRRYHEGSRYLAMSAGTIAEMVLDRPSDATEPGSEGALILNPGVNEPGWVLPRNYLIDLARRRR